MKVGGIDMKIQIIFDQVDDLGKKTKRSITFNNIFGSPDDPAIKKFAQAIIALMEGVEDYKIFKIEQTEII